MAGFPSKAELAGAVYPRTRNGTAALPMEGISLAPLLSGQDLRMDRPLFW